jgi:hypothetical protein
VLLDVVSTLRLLSPSYRFLQDYVCTAPVDSGAQHEISSGPTRMPGDGVSRSAVEYTSAVHASAPH